MIDPLVAKFHGEMWTFYLHYGYAPTKIWIDQKDYQRLLWICLLESPNKPRTDCAYELTLNGMKILCR